VLLDPGASEGSELSREIQSWLCAECAQTCTEEGATAERHQQQRCVGGKRNRDQVGKDKSVHVFARIKVGGRRNEQNW
jgi:hypothetical protein